MTTCRVQKHTLAPGWTQAPNNLMRDPRIKSVAKVIYVLIAGFSADFDFTRKTLEFMAGVKRDAVQAALRELEQHGYLSRTRQRNNLGRWEYSYELTTPAESGENHLREVTKKVSKTVQHRPVPVQPVPDPPVPVKPASLRRTEPKDQTNNTIVRARAASEPEAPLVELQALFRKHKRPASPAFVNRLLNETRARGAQLHDVVSVATEVLTKFRRASPHKVAEYVIERLGRQLRRMSELAVGHNTYDHSRTREVRVLTDEEALRCIPF